MFAQRGHDGPWSTFRPYSIKQFEAHRRCSHDLIEVPYQVHSFCRAKSRCILQQGGRHAEMFVRTQVGSPLATCVADSIAVQRCSCSTAPPQPEESPDSENSEDQPSAAQEQMLARERAAEKVRIPRRRRGAKPPSSSPPSPESSVPLSTT